MERKELDSVLKSNNYLEKNSTNQSTPNRWHCNGDCQNFGDPCPGEKNINNDSENNCPYYRPEQM